MIPQIVKFDLSKFLSSVGILFTEGNSQYQFECPFCRKNKLYVNSVTKLYICFKCGDKGNLFKLISVLSGRDIKNVIAEVMSSVVPLKSSLDLQMLKPPIQLRPEISDEDYINIDQWAFPILEEKESILLELYLEERKITDEVCKKFDLRYAPNLNRIIFPVYLGKESLPVGWIGRDITKQHHLKYLNNPGLKRHCLLYGQHLNFDAEEIVLVEGPVDALKCHLMGGVALMGKFLSRGQINVLCSMPKLKRVYVALDPDAESDASNLINMLLPFWEVFKLYYPSDFDGDIGDLDSTEVPDFIIKNSIEHKKLKHFIKFGREQ